MDAKQIIDHIDVRMDVLEQEWNDLQAESVLLQSPTAIMMNSRDALTKLTRMNELSRLKDDIKDM